MRSQTNQWKTKFTKFFDNSRSFFTKLSQAFMLPISILPIAGLLLGIGGAIGANLKTETAIVFSLFFKGVSEIIFANIAILFGASVAIAFSNKNKIYAAFILIVAYLIFNSLQTAFIHYDSNGNFKDILWMHTDPNIKFIIGNNLGIVSMQTSIFGSIIVGAIVAFVMNRWSEIELKYLNFFSGIRLVPIIILPIIIVLVMLFLLLWPFVGQFIAYLGQQITSVPYGIDGLAYGIIGRALMPLGLHHIIIGIAFQTTLGGQLELQKVQEVTKALNIENHADVKILIAAFKDQQIIVGDQNIYNFLNGLPINTLPNNGGYEPIFQWFNTHLGVYAGRFTQDYPTYLGVVQGIGLAMILVAKKQHRKKAAVLIGSSMFVAFLTGITEPLEFSFLFAAPLYYYLIYVPLSGLSYMFMKLSGAHVGVGFARGFIDYVIYGGLTINKGSQFYWAIPIALAMGLFSFVTMFFGIKKFKWKTPFTTEENSQLIDKKIYQEITKIKEKWWQKKKKKNTNQEILIEKLVNAYGGHKNIKSVLACATRLRITVFDPKLINKATILELGAQGFIEKGTSSQAIFGGKAQILANQINQQYF